MKNSRIHLVLAGALLLGLNPVAFAKPSSSAAKEQETKLIAVLQSSATQKEKADACRALAHLGTKDTAAALAALLSDEPLSHMARYGLETMPGSAADQALRAALPTLRGRQLAGVVTSLGVRRDSSAAKPLAKLLTNPDSEVRVAVARALGSIGTSSAAKALESALPDTSAADRLAICEGLFRCAETFAAKRRQRDAIRIYDHLRALPDAPHQIRAAALRGAILARQNNGVPLLAEAIQGTDWVLADAAARAAMEMPGTGVTTALIAKLGVLTADRQVLVLQILGKRADATALPTVLAAARNGDKTVRITAIRTVAEIGDVSAAPGLADLACDADREISEAARESLAALPGKKADDTVLGMLTSADPAQKIAGINLVTRRRLNSALPALLKLAEDSDVKVRGAALKQLGEFGGEAELPTLLARLDRATGADEVAAIEQALTALCGRIAKPEASADALIAKLPSAKPPQKAALLTVLGSIGGAKALSVVRAAVGDANKDVHSAALAALCDWPTPDVAPELLTLARSPGDAEDKLECLRGYLRWARDADVPVKERLAMCKDATGLITRTQEKKLLLAALGAINSQDAVTQILLFVDDTSAREEACVAIVSIAEKLTKGRNAKPLTPKMAAALEKVAQATANADLAKRAKASLAPGK